jgi:hypothetical protein
MSLAPETCLLTLLAKDKMNIIMPSEANPANHWRGFWENALSEFIEMYERKEVALTRVLGPIEHYRRYIIHCLPADKIAEDEAQFASQGVFPQPKYVEDINAKGVWLCMPHPKSKTLVIRIDLQFKFLAFHESDKREFEYCPLWFGLTGFPLAGLTYILPTFKLLRKKDFPAGFASFAVPSLAGFAKKPEAKPHPTCCLCGKRCDCPYGHNPQPVMEGKCCSECNFTKVLPARIEMMKAAKAEAKAKPKPSNAPALEKVEVPKPSNAPALEKDEEMVSGWVIVEWDDSDLTKGDDEQRKSFAAAALPPSRISVPPMPRDEVCDYLSDEYGWCVNDWKKE